MGMSMRDRWTYYFHDPNDSAWTDGSYKRLATVDTIDAFWMHQLSLAPHLHQGMFFLMRAGVFPTWENAENRRGGCISFKIDKRDLPSSWQDMSIRLMSDSLVRDACDAHLVNGISVSPKNMFCIVKVWLRDGTLTDAASFALPPFQGDATFKKWA